MSASNAYINSVGLINLKQAKGLEGYISLFERLFLLAQDKVYIVDIRGKQVYKNPALVALGAAYANTHAEAAWNSMTKDMNAQMMRAMHMRASMAFVFQREGPTPQFNVYDLLHISPIIDEEDQVLGVLALG